jgi:putative transposase
MARKPRIEYAGAAYHVICRGDRGESIFQDEIDRTQFLRCLGETCERTGWKIHAYVLMPNHYHLLLETPEANLVLGMKWLQGTYTQRFNIRHGVSGHLFQGRYKTLVINGEEQGYFLQVSNYIHLNPVRAGLVQANQPLQSYLWSSFPLYLVPERKRMKWLCVNKVLSELGGYQDNPKGGLAYESYIEELTKRYYKKDELENFNEEWNALRRGWYLGSENFRHRLTKLLARVIGGKQKGTYFGDERRAHDEVQAEGLLQEGLKALGLGKLDLQTGSKGMPEKQVLAWWLRKNTTVSRKWISEHLKMGDVSRVTGAIKLVNLSGDDSVRKLRNRLEEIS